MDCAARVRTTFSVVCFAGLAAACAQPTRASSPDQLPQKVGAREAGWVGVIDDIRPANPQDTTASGWRAAVRFADSNGQFPDASKRSSVTWVLITAKRIVRNSAGVVVPPPGIVRGDTARFWLRELVQLSDPPQAFADSLHVRGRRS